MNFPLKVLRNSLILGLGYFISTISSIEYTCYDDFKPLIIFVGLYAVAELSRHYHINSSVVTKKKRNVTTIIF